MSSNIVTDIKKESNPMRVPVELTGAPPHWLRAVGPGTDDQLVTDAAIFAKWRSLSSESFFDSSKPSLEQSINWNRNEYFHDNSQINFVVETANRPVGFIGLSHINFETRVAELGRVLKDNRYGQKNLMKSSVEALCKWGFSHLMLKCIKLEVFADNTSAVNLYRKTGFVERRSHLRHKMRAGQNFKWIIADASGNIASESTRKVLEMELKRIQ